jgi:DNA adenine methylase
MHASSTVKVGPLLKWAGGKRQLLGVLAGHYPRAFGSYYEPFFGSGAVFFDLLSKGALDGVRVRLSDVNPDLVGCYRTVRDEGEAVIEALSVLDREYRRHGSDCYYEVRDQRFNPQRLALLQSGAAAMVEGYTPDLAAMLVFLNRTGFNGLFRLNRQGAFNVPAGRHTNPRVCDPSHIRAVAGAFQRRNVTIDCRSFDEALAEAAPGDFVYCDPPYEPLSRTASFAHYTASGFTIFDQRRLQQAVIGAARRGTYVVVSNSSAPAIEQEYGTAAARGAKLEMTYVPARRAINSRASARGTVNELIISNVSRLSAIKPRMARMAATQKSSGRKSRTA